MSPPPSLGLRRSTLQVAVSLLAIAAACGAGNDAGWGRGFGGGGRERIGASLASRSHPFYQQLEAGLREGSRRARHEVVVTDADFNASSQRAQAEELLGQRIDALVLAPADTLTVVPAVERANAARIPVFTANLRPVGGRIVSHVESDHVGMGRIAAEYLAAFLGGRGEVALVTRPEVPWLRQREEGFRAAMRAQRGITIVDSVDGGGSRERTRTAVEALLRARRETDAIFSVDDAGVLGAHDAAIARFRTDLFLVGCDASAETLKLIQDEGPLKASVLQQPRRIGERLIELMVRHFDDEPVAPGVLVPVRLVNVDSLRAAQRP